MIGQRAALFALAALLASGCNGDQSPGSTADDAGPLRIDDDNVGMSVQPPPDHRGGHWSASFGSRTICADEAVEITEIEPMWKVAPASSRFLVHTRAPTDDDQQSPFYSALGSAPDFPETYATEATLAGATVDAVHATVDRECDAAKGSGYQEFIVVVGVDGGGADLRNIDVSYETEDGKEYVERLRHWRMVVCGTEVPQHLCD